VCCGPAQVTDLPLSQPSWWPLKAVFTMDTAQSSRPLVKNNHLEAAEGLLHLIHHLHSERRPLRESWTSAEAGSRASPATPTSALAPSWATSPQSRPWTPVWVLKWTCVAWVCQPSLTICLSCWSQGFTFIVGSPSLQRKFWWSVTLKDPSPQRERDTASQSEHSEESGEGQAFSMDSPAPTASHRGMANTHRRQVTGK
jgi:hypothetical protein